MKRILTVALALLALTPLARSEDEPRRKKKHAKAQTEATATASPRASGQTRSARQIAPPFKKNTASNLQRTNVATSTNRTDVARNNLKMRGTRRFASGGRTISFTDARRFDWHTRHDRGWWRAHNIRIILYGGGYWFWNNGWWYPAYGYDPYYSNYVYDGPIYGYGYAAPGEVTSEVQQALAQQGYYRGPIDGILGPMTRGAIERFQADHGLRVTAAIDESTLASLGLA
jgi:hypothetical protein